MKASQCLPFLLCLSGLPKEQSLHLPRLEAVVHVVEGLMWHSGDAHF